jgi:hypothetical protein
MALKVEFGFTRAGRLAARSWFQLDKMTQEAIHSFLKEEARIIREKAVDQSSFTAYPRYVVPGPYGLGDAGGKGDKPRPPMPTKPWEANVHDHGLQKGWRTRVNVSADGGNVLVYNIAPYAGFFTGEPTSRMVGRPVLQAALGESVDKVVFAGQQRFEKAYAAWNAGRKDYGGGMDEGEDDF